MCVCVRNQYSWDTYSNSQVREACCYSALFALVIRHSICTLLKSCGNCTERRFFVDIYFSCEQFDSIHLVLHCHMKRLILWTLQISLVKIKVNRSVFNMSKTVALLFGSTICLMWFDCKIFLPSPEISIGKKTNKKFSIVVNGTENNQNHSPAACHPCLRGHLHCHILSADHQHTQYCCELPMIHWNVI